MIFSRVLRFAFFLILLATYPGTVLQAHEEAASAQKIFGFIRATGKEDGHFWLDVDAAQWIAPCRPATEEADDCPNGFEIVNDDPATTRYVLAPGTQVVTATLYHGKDGNFFSRTLPFASFLRRFRILPEAGSFIPFWLTLEKGVIIRIEEQYVP